MNDIKIIFENDDFIVLDKPAGILTHPTLAGEKDTLVNWLSNKCPEILRFSWPDVNRPGIVHRLDKDTSGLIILAKNPEMMKKLQAQFKNREIKKTYQALVIGHTPNEDKIDIPIVRDNQKDMMRVEPMIFSFSRGTARPATTVYKTLARYRYKSNDLSLVEVYPQTGRMHQIRVHLKHAGFPLVGDQMYSTKLSKKISDSLDINRQFLHATKLEIENQVFKSDLSKDLKSVLNELEAANE